MRASLVVKIIESYYKGEKEFQEAVRFLATEEERKGNSDIASKLLKAIDKNSYEGIENNESKKVFTSANSLFSLSGNIASSNITPKDKETSLELMEIIEPKVSLNDLILSKEMNKSMYQIIDEWKKIKILSDAGIAPTRRILFYGPPGCGKTIMGLALAKELGLKVAYVRLDSLFSSYLGQTSTNLRKIFDAVKDGSMALFLDEFDSIGKKRDDSQEVGELKRIVITLLQNLDLLPPNVLVIAATNHQHLLDPAVWRRFDMTISIDAPSEELRLELIQTQLAEYKKSLDCDFKLLVKMTEGISISRIKDLINQTIKSYLLSERNNKITINDFMHSIAAIEKFNNSQDTTYQWAFELKNRGISLRDLESITNIPKSTLSNHFKKMEVVNESK